jgi:hypothetical protein
MFSLRPPTGPIIEGDRATFTVELSEPSSRPERVVITAIGETASLGRDFSFQNSQQLVFAPGVTSRQFTLNTFNDSIREGIETLRVFATPLSRPATERMTSKLAIYDLAPTTATISSVQIMEGNSGTKNAEFVVQLTAGAILPVTIDYATRNGTATAGSDYTATTGVLTFQPGERRKTVPVPIVGDRIAEIDETFALVLSNPSRGTTLRTSEATCTIVNDEADEIGFQITLDFTTSVYGEVPAAVRTAAQQAADRWEQVITGDLPAFLEVSTGLFVDDFRMRVQMGLLGGAGSDGPSNVLANAQPVQYRATEPQLPWLGQTGIDPSDATSSQLVAILVHEIGHALGFGSGNPGFQAFVQNGTWTGANALREFRSIFGQPNAAGVPLDPEGSAHWSEAVFGNELMTPYTNANMPLSRITIGLFEDLGYEVNYAARDVYSPPPPGGTTPLTSIVTYAADMSKPTAGQVASMGTKSLPPATALPATLKPPAAVVVGKSELPAMRGGIRAGSTPVAPVKVVADALPPSRTAVFASLAGKG